MRDVIFFHTCIFKSQNDIYKCISCVGFDYYIDFSVLCIFI